jgi:hypothetical protein
VLCHYITWCGFANGVIWIQDSPIFLGNPIFKSTCKTLNKSAIPSYIYTLYVQRSTGNYNVMQPCMLTLLVVQYDTTYGVNNTAIQVFTDHQLQNEAQVPSNISFQEWIGIHTRTYIMHKSCGKKEKLQLRGTHCPAMSCVLMLEKHHHHQ